MKTYLLIVILVLLHITATAQSADNYVHKGNEYFKQSEYLLAEQQYRKALDIVPQNTTAQYNLANALYRQKKYDEAHSVLNKLATTASNNNGLKSAAYYNNGAIYSREKDLPASIEAYKNALRLNPHDKQARENLQKALLEQKKQQQDKSKSQNQSNMSQKQAEQKLKQLQEKENELQERMQNRNAGSGGSGAQDW